MIRCCDGKNNEMGMMLIIAIPGEIYLVSAVCRGRRGRWQVVVFRIGVSNTVEKWPLAPAGGAKT